MPQDWIICSSDMLCKEHLREYTIDNLTYITLTSSIHQSILLYTVVRAFETGHCIFLKLHVKFEKKSVL